MNHPSFIRLPAALLAAAFLAACGESGTGPDPNRVETVQITPDDPTISVGDDVQLQATPLNSDDEPVSGKTVTWSSSDDDVASVSTSGLVSGEDAGTAEITATVDGKSASVTVTVEALAGAPVVTAVSPATLVPGESATLSGTDLTSTTQVYVNGVRAVVTQAGAGGVQFTVPCVAPGAAAVVARNGAANSPDFAANVNATPSAPMAVGDFRTLSGSPCLQLPAAGAQTYLIGIQSVSEDATSLSSVTFGIDAAGAVADVAASAGAFRSSPVRAAFQPVVAGDADARRLAAHRQAELALRAQDIATTEALMRAGVSPQGTATFKTAGVADVPNVGDLVDMRYPNLDKTNLCEDPFPVTGRVEHVSERAIFVADTANPAGGFTASDYAHFGSVFDDSIYGPQTTYFGSPTDNDDNGRIIVLLTKEVNRRDNILGMVVSVDFFPRTSCPASDEGEIYYGRVPDPNGEFGPAYSLSAARLHVPGLIAHEVTHITQFGRRFAMPNYNGLQALWEMESQATLAEEVIGHRFNVRQSGQNYGFDVAWENCGSDTGVAWYCDKFQDLALYYGFLTGGANPTSVDGAPEQCSFVGRPDQGNDGPCQSQRMIYTGWSFLRWLSDHYGDALGGEGQLHRQLIDNTTSGFTSIARVVGQPIHELLGRWAATLYTDDRFAGVGGTLSLPSWNLYDIEQHLVQSARLDPYDHTFTDASRNASVRGGSSAYFLVSGPRLASAVRATTTTGGTLPVAMRMWVVRVQ